MPEVKTRVGTVRIAESGEGPPIVLLHATLHDHHDYDEVREALSRGNHVLAVDWPGHGESDPLPHGTRAGGPLFADVLEDIVRERELPPAAFIGNSIGGYAAARLALRQPHRVTGLVLANSGGFGTPTGFNKLVCRLLGTPAVSRRVFPAFVPRYMKAANESDRAIESRAIAQSQTREGAAVAAGIWRSFLDPDYNLSAEAPHITAPTLLVWGANDPVLPLREGQRIQTLIPGSALTALPTGHVTFSSDPAGFLNVVEPFLKSLAPGRPNLPDESH